MTQSAGWCIGFAFSPPHRMAPIVQLLATAAVCAVGTALTLPELPAAKLDLSLIHISEPTRPY